MSADDARLGEAHPRTMSGGDARLGSAHPRAVGAGDSRWWGRPLAEMRWTLELSRLLVDPAFLGVGLPRGDGRPVVLLPGFLAGDPTLGVMAGWLYRLGYSPRTSGFVANADCSERAFERVAQRSKRCTAGTAAASP